MRHAIDIAVPAIWNMTRAHWAGPSFGTELAVTSVMLLPNPLVETIIGCAIEVHRTLDQDYSNRHIRCA